ncbi:phosphate ABC transporter permease PstA [Rhodohalobacter sp. SW132]|uniref:phosphate ABC transporter permease PstA n=1 Tax=Rhodohalobacter sp. SW132 TaxID=2293433 RepID=UPI000E252B6C|nr:phosphate ABC transporter permease PstA [Rhodohalobacter sp. SW132]REL24545.1 phosphate ABC transporter permease PstA [Rhodohalobacter sp. SW132]
MKSLKRRKIHDRIMVGLLSLSTIVVLLPLVIIIVHVFVEGFSALSYDFFTEELGSPSRAIQGRPTGLVHTIIGTIVVDSMALFIAVPVGIGAGMMLSEYPEHLLNPSLRIMNDTLNGMPAILKGLFIFVLIVKPMGTFSGIAGSVALAVVMLPIIARTTESALQAIPWTIREAGLALGIPRWRVVLSTVMPTAKAGLITGVLLAFARAAGEAAPLLFTSFGDNYLPNSWLGFIFSPTDTLPQRLYSLAISPYEQWHSMGWAAAIVLFMLVIFTFIIARLLARDKFRKQA